MQSPTNFHQIARDYSALIKAHQLNELQAQTAAQLSNLVGNGMLLVLSYEELEGRGYPLSKSTKALLEVFKLLALGSGNLSLGIALDDQALNLTRLMEELITPATAQQIATSPAIPDSIKQQVAQEAPIIENVTTPAPNTGNVVSVDFAARRKLH